MRGRRPRWWKARLRRRGPACGRERGGGRRPRGGAGQRSTACSREGRSSRSGQWSRAHGCGLTLASADPSAAPVLDPRISPIRTTPPSCSRRSSARELATTEPLRSLDRGAREPAGSNGVVAVDVRPAVRILEACCVPWGDLLADQDAVCDTGGRLHGFERIVVADCSLIPVVPARTRTCRPS